ncbi:MAG TPA: MBL fold metallo-hydrolase [Bacillota bacterium]|nr:MBL fold metallo-hydrolase [Bacillota bacterium]
MIKYKNIRILLDGIQSEGDFPFSKTPPALLSQMLTPSGTGPFNNLDYLIFSHPHPDHFSPDIVAQYVRCNEIRRILYPQGTDPRLKLLEEAIRETNTPSWTFSMNGGHIHQYRLTKDILLTTLCTRHMKQMFADNTCNCLLLQIGGKNILFLTDCSCEEEELLAQFRDFSIDMVFLNPYFYYDKRGRDVLEHIIRPAQTVIYHLPFEEDDQIKLRALARQIVRKYPLPRVILMEEPFQSLEL